MHPREIVQFRDEVAMPRMLQLFERTQIPNGTCFIDKLELSFLDGRSCGADSQFTVSGFLYKDGTVKEYSFSECDMELTDFVDAHKNCIFVADGQLIICNELAEMEINTTIRNLGFCSKLFPELDATKDLRLESSSIPYEKLIYMSQHTSKPQLEDRIQSAAHCSQISQSNPNIRDPEFYR